MNYNHVTLCGRLTRDVELKNVGAKNTPLATFGLAVNKKWTGGEEVLFIECVCWGKGAELLKQYVGKGSTLLVDGHLKFERWEKDGVMRSTIKVNVETFQFGAQDGERKPAASGTGERYGASSDAGGIPL